MLEWYYEEGEEHLGRKYDCARCLKARRYNRWLNKFNEGTSKVFPTSIIRIHRSHVTEGREKHV